METCNVAIQSTLPGSEPHFYKKHGHHYFCRSHNNVGQTIQNKTD